jgi:hypothetical protein
MKGTKMLFRLGMAALALAFVIVLAGCPTDADEDSNPFVGTWTGTAMLGGDSASATITVTDSGWTFVCADAGMNETGTYTRSGDSATLSQGTTTFGTAAISGNTLAVTVTSGDYRGGSGVFTK